MSDGFSRIDRDSLVAAILSTAALDSSDTAKHRIDAFQHTLEELVKRGGCTDLWRAAKGLPPYKE